MNARQRVIAAIEHREPDRVPLDLGATPSSGISAIAYGNFKSHLGMTGGHARVYDVVQQLAQPEDPLLDRFHVDVLDVGRTFNADDSDWYDVTLADGQTAQYPTWFQPEPVLDGSWIANSPDGAVIARMPKDGTFFNQVHFPWLDGYPDSFGGLADAMRKVLWAALAHGPWDHAAEPDFWEKLRTRALALRASTDRALVDLMGHSHIGEKTVLYLLDGLYSGLHPIDRAPRRWSSYPFDGDWTSSLFASQDPVAIDSVGFDFLWTEYPDFARKPGVDDYLHEAALADNPPSGTFYDPDHASNVKKLASLGVHERWNNPEEKKYSRNLGTGKGIELVAVTMGASSEMKSVVAPGAKLIKLSGEFEFTEGPAADAEGNVFFTDQPNDRIMKWSVDGKLSTFLQPCGRSNGLYFDKKGNLLACADEKNELWSIDPAGKATVLVRDYKGKLLNGPNDLWVRPDGGIYFTDPFYKRPYWKRGPMEQERQCVYYLSADYRTLNRVAEDLVQPNGIIGTPDGKKLYVADIGAGKTYAYDINDDGTLSNKKLFCEMGSDGMAIDNEGNVYLTGKSVPVFDKNGNKVEQIAVPEPWTANVCFGGKDRDTLFITASKSLYAVRTRVKGAK